MSHENRVVALLRLVLVLLFGVLLLVGVAVVGPLMVVMRALLRQATALRTDLEGVV